MNLALFLELGKDCDTMDHSIPMKKLNSYGIVDTAGDWFESYLKSRTQFFTLNGNKSNRKKSHTVYLWVLAYSPFYL